MREFGRNRQQRKKLLFKVGGLIKYFEEQFSQNKYFSIVFQEDNDSQRGKKEFFWREEKSLFFN